MKPCRTIQLLLCLLALALIACQLPAEERAETIRFAAEKDGSWVLLNLKGAPVSQKKYKDVVFLKGELSDLVVVKEDEVGWSILTSSNEVFRKGITIHAV